MRYRNTKTGAVITVASPIRGRFWEPYDELPPAPKAEDAPKPRVKKTAKKE